MRTRSQARRRRQPQVRQTSVESSNLEKPDNPPIITMADNRTMAQLLEAPTEGYEDAIVILEITANNFEIRHGLLNLVQNKQFLEMIKKTHMLTSVISTRFTLLQIEDSKTIPLLLPHHLALPPNHWDALIMGFRTHQLDTFYNSQIQLFKIHWGELKMPVELL
ncbi:hypothetical protein Tco_0934060 [Tanacetum coccineum]